MPTKCCLNCKHAGVPVGDPPCDTCGVNYACWEFKEGLEEEEEEKEEEGNEDKAVD